jgi:hypothetical protein
LPTPIVRAVRLHGGNDRPKADKLAQVLAAGHAIAHGLDVRNVHVEVPSVGDALRLAGLPTSAGRTVLKSIEQELAAVSNVLTEIAP